MLTTPVTIPQSTTPVTTTTTTAATTISVPIIKTRSTKQRALSPKVSTLPNIFLKEMESTTKRGKTTTVAPTLTSPLLPNKRLQSDATTMAQVSEMSTTTAEEWTSAILSVAEIETTISRSDFTRSKYLDTWSQELFDSVESSSSQGSDNKSYTELTNTIVISPTTAMVAASTAFGHDMHYDKDHKQEVEMNLIQPENPTLNANNSPAPRNDGTLLLMIIFRYESVPAFVTFAVCIASMAVLFGAFLALAMTPMPCGSLPRLLQVIFG